VTKTSYDAVGNVSSITDADLNTTNYTYDAVNHLITDTNQLNKTRTRSYDNVGNLTQTVDRNGRKVSYNYDTLNRQTAEKWLDGSNATIKTFSSSYDAIGHLLSSINSDSSYSYSYDAVDRVSSIDNTGTVGVPAVKFNYSYDAVGNLLTVNDSINGTSAGTTGYSYDLLNRVTKLTQAGTGVQSKRVDMAYNAVNQLTSLSRFSGVNSVADTSYTYDNNQRLIQLSHKKGVSTIASFDYGYDAADKLASTISSVDGTSSYSYDSTNQLTGASHTAQTNEAYSYDANGNRTSGGTVTSANNQLLSDGTYNYTYDGEGNRTRRTEIASGKVTEYVWDYRNRLTAVLFKDASGNVTKTIDYIYDGSNQRIGKRIDGAVTERYVIDRNQIALVFDGASIQTHRYLYGTQIDQVLADETGVSTNWFLADNQGTVKDVVDGNGAVIDHIVYDSFGKVESQSNAGYDLRFGYTGREQDSETGLDYYRARYYDASNGRFISEDPLEFKARDSNLTRYVKNNVLNLVDPFGLEDMRWPSNGSVINLSDRPIYPLVSNHDADHYEVLYPNKQTFDRPGYSADPDGVWVQRDININGAIQKKWYFFPIEVDAVAVAKRLAGKKSPLVRVYNDRVLDQYGKRIYGWSPEEPNKNLRSCPNDPNPNGKRRGRDSARKPPIIGQKYPDAGKDYIEPNPHSDQERKQGEIERFYRRRKEPKPISEYMGF
jgi:RHS repeat-associated protein